MRLIDLARYVKDVQALTTALDEYDNAQRLYRQLPTDYTAVGLHKSLEAIRAKRNALRNSSGPVEVGLAEVSPQLENK